MLKPSIALIALFSLFPQPGFTFVTPNFGDVPNRPSQTLTVQGDRSLSEEEFLQRVTVEIVGDNNRASGTIIAKKGDTYLVLTNSHATRGAKTLQIRTHDSQSRAARIVPNSLSENKDLALLEFSDTRDYPIAPIGKFTLNEDEIGLEVVATGYVAETGQYRVTKGTIERVSDRPLAEGYSIGYSGEIAQGMSGGGIFVEGELIGINGRSASPILSNYTYEDGTKPTEAEIQKMRAVNWGIPVNTLLAYIRPEILTAYKLPLPPAAPGIETAVNTGYIAELEKKARGFTVRIDSTNGTNGSGVIIAREGKTYTVLTADHVLCEKIAGATTCADFSYTVITSDGQTRNIEKSTIIRQEGVDLAVFRFQSEETHPIAELGNYTPNTGEVVLVAGYPKIGDQRPVWRFNGGFAQDKEGGLLQTRQSDLETQGSASLQGTVSLTGGYELVYSSITYGGMSGGAVLDSSGRVIGIHGRAEGGEVGRIQLGYSLGIPIGTFIGLKDRFQTNPDLVATAPAEIDRQQQQELRGAIENIKIPATNAPAEIWIERGGQLWRLKRYEEAVTAFDRAIAQNRPENVFLAWYGKGMALFDLGEYPPAIKALEQAIATLPADRDLKKFQAIILQQQSVIYRYGEDLENALKTIDRAIALSPENPNFYNEKYGILEDLKRYDEALPAINRAIALAPRAAWYLNRGVLYKEQQKPDLALADYSKAIEINPRYVAAYNNRGVLYKEQQKPDLALSDYNKAIKINPRYADAYNNRGVLYKDQQKPDLALADYNQAIEINRRYADAYYNRGNLYADQQKPDLALADYNQAIEINPRLAEAYLNRGVLYYSRQETEKAIKDFRQAAELFRQQGNAGAYEGVMKVLRQLGAV
jgi:tetratricopeptide (TPR) repeat protein/S1-C subfamily serine protease